MDETIYYNEDNVKVTNTQVMSEGRMHTLNSINSAQIMAMHHKRTAILFFGIMLSILSLGSSLYLPVFIFLALLYFGF